METLYNLGALVRCSVEFRDDDDALTDPAVVKFSVATPAGTVTTYTYGTDAALVKASTGAYHVDVNANVVGRWPYRFFSTGSAQSAVESAFIVSESAFD